MVVAIDGPAGSGKSTVARAVAERLGAQVLDTGAMYRAIALTALDRGAALDDGRSLGALAGSVTIDQADRRTAVDGVDVEDRIRTERVGAAASAVAAHPQVRDALVAAQQAVIADGDWVAEGRDIGTVVAPDAAVKVFLTADPAVRARRRVVDEATADHAEVAAAHVERDRRDSERAHGALRAAGDAITLDTTDLRIEEVVERIVALATDAASRTATAPAAGRSTAGTDASSRP